MHIILIVLAMWAAIFSTWDGAELATIVMAAIPMLYVTKVSVDRLAEALADD